MKLAHLLLLVVISLSTSFVSAQVPALHVEAENYSLMFGVQTEPTSDIGGGVNLAYIENGDYSEYLINPTSSGSYSLKLRVATTVANTSIQVLSNGILKTTAVLPLTGGWQKWQTVTVPITLNAGSQQLRLLYKSYGLNINWFELSESGALPVNQLPVANAGVDKSITLPVNNLIINGSASDSDGTVVSYAWSQISGGAATLTNASSANLSIASLVEGTYVFRLTATDNSGASAYDDISVVVNPVPVAATLHIEAENYSSMLGVQTEPTSDVGGGVNLSYIENGDYSEYLINLPSAGSYLLKLRVATTAANTSIDIFSNMVLKATATLPLTGGWQKWQTVTMPITLNAGSQQLRLLYKSSGLNINWFELSNSGALPVNQLPVANAGVDKSITLPVNNLIINGSASDSDGTVVSYAWSQISGGAATLTNASSANLSLANLVQGNYVFRLTATDNSGASAYDDVSVNVSAAPSGQATFINDKIKALASGYQINAVIYLPPNYSPTTSYPLVFFFHGSGEAGTNIANMYNTGLPQVLATGYRPAFDFIMIAPQAPSYGSNPDWLPYMLADALSRFNIDQKRIYLTGLSAGGWATYGSQMNVSIDFGKKFAAIVPLSGATQDIDRTHFDWWANTKTPVWSVAGGNDLSYAENNVYFVQQINLRNPGSATATTRPGVGHGGWNDVYNGSVKHPSGLDMWQWMYQFTRP